MMGLWEVKAIHHSDEPGYKETPPGMFKMVLPDGKFVNFMYLRWFQPFDEFGVAQNRWIEEI